MRHLLVFVGLGLGLTGALVADPTIQVTPSTAELTVGDQFELTIDVRTSAPAATTDAVVLPEWGDRLGPAEIVSVAPLERTDDDGGTLFRQRLLLTLFRVGETTLPPIDVTVIEGERETPLTSVSSPLTVHSVLPTDGSEAQVKPAAPPLRATLGSRFWWTASSLLATLVLAFAALWQRTRTGEHAAATRPRLAPMEELRQSLAGLRAGDEVVAIHAGLSLALRRYLGRVLEFHAAESTTTEIRRALRSRQSSPDLVRDTDRLLSACDLVKFARRRVEPSTAMVRVETAERLAVQLETSLRPSAPAEPATVSGGE